MKLADCIRLVVNTKSLAKLAGVSDRQIRRMRTDPRRQIPDVEISNVEIENLILESDTKTQKDKFRELWYVADAACIKIMQEQEKLWKQICAIPNFDTTCEEAQKKLEEIDSKITMALNMVAKARSQAEKEGVEPIWNPQERIKKKILKYFDCVHEDLKKPSDRMRDRIIRKVNYDLPSTPKHPGQSIRKTA